jgi:hypothetical protein
MICSKGGEGEGKRPKKGENGRKREEGEKRRRKRKRGIQVDHYKSPTVCHGFGVSHSRYQPVDYQGAAAV